MEGMNGLCRPRERGNTAGVHRRNGILDAAVAIFADRGFQGTTIRAIAEQAGTTATLVIYHFDTKLDLYKAVFDRYRYLGEEGRRQLRAVDTSAADAVEQIIDALLLAMRSPQGNEAGRTFTQLLLREASDPLAHGRGLIVGHLAAIGEDFVAAMRQAVRAKPLGFYEWAYWFSVAAVTGTAASRGVGVQSVPESVEGRYDYLRSFLIAAWRG